MSRQHYPLLFTAGEGIVKSFASDAEAKAFEKKHRMRLRGMHFESRVVAASAEERAAYAKTSPCYPLFGWVLLRDESGERHRCAVEDLRGSWSSPDPIFEVMMPPGMWLSPSYTHSALAHSLKDCVRRLSGEHLAIDTVEEPGPSRAEALGAQS